MSEKNRSLLLRKNKKLTLAALLMLLSFALSIVAVPVAAHDPPIDIPTYAYLSLSPDPAGVNQAVFVVMWLHGAPPTAYGIAGDRWHGFYVEVTKPDGGIEHLGPFVSDPTGSAFTIYTPDQIGTYTFKFSYTGQILGLVNPTNGIAVDPTDPMLSMMGGLAYVGDNYLPSSTTATLTVQTEEAKTPETYPLPTEYWTRPIEGQNTNWASITSNWLLGAQLGAGGFGGGDLWQKDGAAPDTSHVMWTKPIEFGGIVGGSSEISDVGFYSGGSYEGRFQNAIIMYGRLYFNLPLGHEGGNGGYLCIDLRTGEELWYLDDLGTRTNPAPSKGQLYDYESMNQHGVVGGILWQVNGGGGFFGMAAPESWVAYDAFSGQWLYNLTGVGSGTEVYLPDGEIVRYQLNAMGHWMALLNSTAEQQGLQGAIGTGTDAYQWRPNGKSVNMSQAYSWNVTIPDLPGNSMASIYQVLPGDIILGTSSNVNGFGTSFTPDPYTVWALSDDPSTRGDLLWIRSYPAPEGNITRKLGPVDIVNRVWTMYDTETMQWLGYSLDSGEPLWGPTQTEVRDFGYYGSGLGAGQVGFAAYGNIYTQGYGGEIYCYNTLTGEMVWKYNNTQSGAETPWGLYPTFIAAIADGKVYVFNNEHSPNYPLYKDEQVRCIDAFSGEELWSIMSWAGQTGGPGSSTAALADGFLTYYNYYDNQIYCIGKGSSATTVTCSPKLSKLGNSVLIEGTIVDTSPSTSQNEQAKRFPNGVPAVSDESMDDWMEYVYLQKPKPDEVTGVTVYLTALDPNGNTQEIGYAISDALGNYAYEWAPPVPGPYTITATFEGSGAYYCSEAGTTFIVSEAVAAEPTSTLTSTATALPTPTPTPAQSVSPSPSEVPEPPTSGMPTTTYIAIGAAVVIIVAAAAVLLFRRRK
jgi:outer membrane protein assembly factor BamB